MNILDHNFPEDQLPNLSNWRIHFKKIGRDIGRPTWADWEEIHRLLHSLKQPTFFTRDNDFYHPGYRHAGYCVVFLDIPVLQSSDFVRRFLSSAVYFVNCRHPDFRTKRLRMGKVARISSHRISYWEINSDDEKIVEWIG